MVEPLRGQGWRVGSPAVNTGGWGMSWMLDFWRECNGSCHPDFLAVHFVSVPASYPSSLFSLHSSLARLADSKPSALAPLGRSLTLVQPLLRLAPLGSDTVAHDLQPARASDRDRADVLATSRGRARRFNPGQELHAVRHGVDGRHGVGRAVLLVRREVGHGKSSWLSSCCCGTVRSWLLLWSWAVADLLGCCELRDEIPLGGACDLLSVRWACWGCEDAHSECLPRECRGAFPPAEGSTVPSLRSSALRSHPVSPTKPMTTLVEAPKAEQQASGVHTSTRTS